LKTVHALGRPAIGTGDDDDDDNNDNNCLISAIKCQLQGRLEMIKNSKSTVTATDNTRNKE